jgi:hypothetical protein
MRPLSEIEARVFLEAARGDRFEPLYVLAITTGLRRGELLGLRWDDADLERELCGGTRPREGRRANTQLTLAFCLALSGASTVRLTRIGGVGCCRKKKVQHALYFLMNRVPMIHRESRGRATFLPGHECPYAPSAVLEVTFLDWVTLPPDTEVSDDPQDGWKELFTGQ